MSAQPVDANGTLPRLALTRSEAARSLGMSLDSFERHVQTQIRLVRRGKLRLVPVAELERWLEANAAGTFD
jgi:excisionase family DNA binding protein